MRGRRRPGFAVSPAEEKAVELLSKGGTDKTIARDLGKDYITVRDQIQSAKKKLGAKTRAHLIMLWVMAKI